MIQEETKIFLNPEDVELFKIFMENYETVKALNSSGAFNVGYGKVIMNYAGNILQNITIEEIKYKK